MGVADLYAACFVGLSEKRCRPDGTADDSSPHRDADVGAVIRGPTADFGGHHATVSLDQHRPGLDCARVVKGQCEATKAVAARLGTPAVGVAELHGGVAPALGTAGDYHSVRTDAAAAVAEPPHELDVDLAAGHVAGQGSGIERDEEVVAEAVVLEERDSRHRCPVFHRSITRSASRSSSARNHAIRGSRRNHASWRRAKLLRRLSASDRASSSEHPPCRYSRISR